MPGPFSRLLLDILASSPSHNSHASIDIHQTEAKWKTALWMIIKSESLPLPSLSPYKISSGEDMSTRYMSFTAADARPPKRASYVNLYKWPESDVDFVKSVAGGSRAHRRSCSKRKWVLGQPSPSDSYSWRQMYLRSYVFTTKKETVTERTRRYLRRIKTRVARFPLLMRRMSDDGIQLYDRKMKKKGCGEVMVRKLKSLVGRFFSCTAGPGGSVSNN